MTEQGQHPIQEDLKAGYEISDVSKPRLFMVIAVIAVVLIIAIFVLQGYFIEVQERITREQVLEPQSEALQQLHEREQEALHSYGTIDTAQGIYRIPIDQAMRLEAQEDFRARTQGE